MTVTTRTCSGRRKPHPLETEIGRLRGLLEDGNESSWSNTALLDAAVELLDADRRTARPENREPGRNDPIRTAVDALRAVVEDPDESRWSNDKLLDAALDVVSAARPGGRLAGPTAAG